MEMSDATLTNEESYGIVANVVTARTAIGTLSVLIAVILGGLIVLWNMSDQNELYKASGSIIKRMC